MVCIVAGGIGPVYVWSCVFFRNPYKVQTKAFSQCFSQLANISAVHMNIGCSKAKFQIANSHRNKLWVSKGLSPHVFLLVHVDVSKLEGIVYYFTIWLYIYKKSNQVDTEGLNASRQRKAVMGQTSNCY